MELQTLFDMIQQFAMSAAQDLSGLFQVAITQLTCAACEASRSGGIDPLGLGLGAGAAAGAGAAGAGGVGGSNVGPGRPPSPPPETYPPDPGGWPGKKDPGPKTYPEMADEMLYEAVDEMLDWARSWFPDQ